MLMSFVRSVCTLAATANVATSNHRRDIADNLPTSTSKTCLYNLSLLPSLLLWQVNCIPPEQASVLECYQTLSLYAKGQHCQTTTLHGRT